MFDTVKAKIHGEWGEPPDPAKWTLSAGEKTVTKGEDERHVTSVFWHHQETGLRVWGDSLGPMFCEASLPRMIYSGNGHLIADQGSLDRALKGFWELASSVATDVRPCRWLRLDTVWQFEGSPASWVFALQGVRVPFSRKPASTFFGESITWNGRKSTLRIYDKGLEAYNKRDMGVVRVELESKSAALRGTRKDNTGDVVQAMLRGGGDAGRLSFDNGYHWFRANVQQLPPFRIPRPVVRSVPELLAYLTRDGVTIEGVPAVDWWLSGRSRRTAFRYRKTMASVRFREAVVVDLSDLLPEDSLPPVVNCLAV